jgi:hypothetical protein
MRPKTMAPKREDERGGLVGRHEELLGDDRGQRAVQVEVVPLEDGAEGGGEDDHPLFLGDPGSLARDICHIGLSHSSNLDEKELG